MPLRPRPLSGQVGLHSSAGRHVHTHIHTLTLAGLHILQMFSLCDGISTYTMLSLPSLPPPVQSGLKGTSCPE